MIRVLNLALLNIIDKLDIYGKLRFVYTIFNLRVFMNIKYINSLFMISALVVTTAQAVTNNQVSDICERSEKARQEVRDLLRSNNLKKRWKELKREFPFQNSKQLDLLKKLPLLESKRNELKKINNEIDSLLIKKPLSSDNKFLLQRELKRNNCTHERSVQYLDAFCQARQEKQRDAEKARREAEIARMVLDYLIKK
jgi:hypothetical protein